MILIWYWNDTGMICVCILIYIYIYYNYSLTYSIVIYVWENQPQYLLSLQVTPTSATTAVFSGCSRVQPVQPVQPISDEPQPPFPAPELLASHGSPLGIALWSPGPKVTWHCVATTSSPFPADSSSAAAVASWVTSTTSRTSKSTDRSRWSRRSRWSEGPKNHTWGMAAGRMA